MITCFHYAGNSPVAREIERRVVMNDTSNSIDSLRSHVGSGPETLLVRRQLHCSDDFLSDGGGGREERREWQRRMVEAS